MMREGDQSGLGDHVATGGSGSGLNHQVTVCVDSNVAGRSERCSAPSASSVWWRGETS